MTLHDKFMPNNTTCDYCGSFNLGVNNQGFVICKTCGLEQDYENIADSVKVDENNLPVDHKVFSSISRTTIGNSSERITKEKFKKLEKYQRFNSYIYENSVYRRAYQEIRAICSRLSLPINFARDSFGLFKRIWRKLTPRTKERSIEGLVPVIVYRTAQMLEFPITVNEIIAVSECDIKKFNSILFSTINKFPTINKIKEVMKRISIVSDELDLPEPVFSLAIKILDNNRSILLSTTNSNAAGTSIALAVLSRGLRQKFRIYKIAESSGTSASAITSRISKVLLKNKVEIENKIIKIENFLLKYPSSILEANC